MYFNSEAVDIISSILNDSFVNFFNSLILWSSIISIVKWKKIAKLDIDASESIVNRAKEIMQKGVKKKDALHVACAMEAKCHYFLSTDKKLLNASFSEINVVNPIDFIKILDV